MYNLSKNLDAMGKARSVGIPERTELRHRTQKRRRQIETLPSGDGIFSKLL